MSKQVKLFDTKIDLKFYKLIIIFNGKKQSTTKGKTAVTFYLLIKSEEHIAKPIRVIGTYGLGGRHV